MEEFNFATTYNLGLDVEEVYRDVENIIMCMNKFVEPAFMQLEYYRYLEHVGVNADTSEEYRKADPWIPSDDNDPIFLARKKLIDAKVNVLSIEQSINIKVYKALEFAKNGVFSDISETYKDVFYD
jgi:TPP-dependent pyruvate/acetoin dehydrogenase alpha subunit